MPLEKKNYREHVPEESRNTEDSEQNYTQHTYLRLKFLLLNSVMTGGFFLYLCLESCSAKNAEGNKAY